MRLNPTKYAFRIKSEKFLGFIMSKRGIGASLEKIETILNMKLPKNLNETQRLAGNLSRFIARTNAFIFLSTTQGKSQECRV